MGVAMTRAPVAIRCNTLATTVTPVSLALFSTASFISVMFALGNITLTRTKPAPKRHPLKVALILTALIVAVPSVALTAIGLGLTVGVLFGWMNRGLGKT